MITCPRCGASNPSGTRFCNECGLSLEGVAEGARLAPAAVAEPAAQREADPATGPAGMQRPTTSSPEATETYTRPREAPVVEETRELAPKRDNGNGGGFLKVLATLLLAAVLIGVGWALGSTTQSAPMPTVAPTATATFSPEAALEATIRADSQVQSVVTLNVGPEGSSHPVPWGGTISFAAGSVSSPVTATIERLPDAPGGNYLPGPARVFQIRAVQTDNDQPLPTFSGPVTLTGMGTQCLIHQGNGEFEPIGGQQQGGQLACQIPRPGILAMLRG